MQVREMTDLQGVTERLIRLERGSFSQPWTVDDFQLLAADDRAINVGLWRGSELAGYALGYVEGEEFHLASLAVEAAHRRRGWGSRLVREVLHKAVLRGCCRCRLEVRRSNAAAIILYERFGFHQVATKQRFYTSPAEDALVMEMGTLDEQQLSRRVVHDATTAHP